MKGDERVGNLAEELQEQLECVTVFSIGPIEIKESIVDRKSVV